MKDCIDQKTFSRYLEDSLEPEVLIRIEAHCRICERCAGELAGWKVLKEKLRETADVEVPDGLKEKVMSRIAGEKILPARREGGARRGLAAAIVFAAALYYLFRPVLRPILFSLISAGLKFLSALWYNALSAVGMDPAILIRLFGKIMAGFGSLLPVFMAATFLMVTGLVVLIIRGRAARQPG
ncbi:MAG TPA: hypothetical protein PLD49_01595 [Thermoclostridium caenicola]|uniref:anti-sigma factor family protein n=1 Tax=Thermoclostridium caenicola TaxID=659425 RepID=UPI002C617C93|nr:hypothetical protein [Thermoclostridium caenicola]HOK42348.1 hypothetical protein [Thermoclostridium caenicola]HOL84181.1 hypothetical protein [Thermoclostridium caenicola]HPO75949.1 hypothetical protein [Thermoclostridium caenicola]